MISEVRNGSWGGDFWIYAAVVRQLSEHPLHPSNPLLAVAAPHQFYSPYALCIALASRWLRVAPTAMLAIAGLVNLGLFLVGFRRFVVTLTGSTAAAAYALLFTLVLWGPGLAWSGFLKLNSIGLVLSYASTFA